jgi:hypothetical protein
LIKEREGKGEKEGGKGGKGRKKKKDALGWRLDMKQ